MAPKAFGGKVIAETPTTDPAILIGRNVETTVMDLTGNKSYYYMKLKFRISKVENKTAETEFNGFECIREHLTRSVRKRSDKIENVFYAETKDGWKIQISTLTASLRKTDSAARTGIRNVLKDYFIAEVKKAAMEKFAQGLMEEKYKKESRALINKVYPTKFHEVAKVEMVSRPMKAASEAAPKVTEEEIAAETKTEEKPKIKRNEKGNEEKSPEKSEEKAEEVGKK